MSNLLAEKLVRTIPDFPEPGIQFKDITPVLQNAEATQELIKHMTEQAEVLGADVIVGIESRGFIFGMPIAVKMGKGFAPVRKLGKLPAETINEEYALEYGTNTVEIHSDAIKPGQKVVIVDDLLATGGTAAASARLVERLGGVVCGFVFFIELEFLQGRKNLLNYEIRSIIQY